VSEQDVAAIMLANVPMQGGIVGWTADAAAVADALAQ
jgi:4-diphosphocytidyl-2C-methyl-D-erythritol kinase